MQRFSGAMRGIALLLSLCLTGTHLAEARLGSSGESNANPIRKVVTMLQNMQKKVTKEGEKEKALYEKFMCYCKTSGGDLQSSISAAETKVPQLGSDIEESKEKLVNLKETLKQDQVDREGAKKAMTEATSLREKEAASFADLKSEYDANIAAIRKAVAAITKGMAGAFLQSNAAQILKQLINGRQSMIDEDRDAIAAFLGGKALIQGTVDDGSSYAPSSGQITGILKSMDDEMSKALAEATATENSAIDSYKSLMSAKTKEVDALTKAIEKKTKQIGDLGVAIVQMQDDLDDTAAALMDDKKFLADLDKSCSTKTAEWEERCKTRTQELLALADTIKILNDDDALELFKKTLPAPSASFMQLEFRSARLMGRALAAVRKAIMASGPDGSRAQLDLIALALQGKKVDFSKVLKMIDDMVALLKKEQVDDDSKKEYCQMQLDLSDDRKKELERSVSDAETAIDNAKKGIETTTEEIAALEKGIAALDKSVMEASVQRKEENKDFKELVASDSAAKELLHIAKNRLNKFYNPKLYKAPPKKELSEAGRIEANFAFVEVSEHVARKHREAPPPPPETFGSTYGKKSEESTGVIAMIDLLVADLDKEITEATAEEKDAQGDYEEMMSDSAAKRVADSKSLTEKVGMKADLEGELMDQEGAAKDAKKELMATLKYISSLHGECDWLLQYFDVRKEARAAEIQSLGDAKAVLSGADFSLLQSKAQGFLGRFA